MKKRKHENNKPANRIKTLVLLAMIFMVNGLYAQLTLEHTYNYSGTLTELSDNEFKYFVQDVPLKQCRIYNEDHTLFKTINLNVPSGYYLFDTKFVTKHLFNSDDYVEVLFMYQKTMQVEGVTVYYYGLKVINELGTVLLNLPDAGHAEIKEGSDGKKLLTYKYIYSTGYYLVYTNVYALGETVKSAPAEAEKSGINIYPNPASDMLTLTIDPEENIKKAEVLITDMSGKQLIKKPIGQGENTTSIETGWMSPGTYVLSLISNKKIIGTEKIEIK